ncbi:hypothetical protein [Candidatus Palauibacter sp.]|uniref:hypothetical protein n=1 Tax=Candidatus Palauibacter sp. TaxID=3101350 RepID=UPI003B01B6E6
MKSVFPLHSGWLAISSSVKSLALIRSLPSGFAAHSISNAVVFPDPGSPSSTYAGALR